jgi:hypothetical protein
MKKTEIKEDIKHLIKTEVFKKLKELGISLDINEEDFLIYGDVLRKENFKEINIYVDSYISQSDCAEKYQDYDTKKYKNEDYTDGAIQACNDLKDSLSGDNALQYKGMPININFQLDLISEVMPNEESKKIKSFIQEQFEKSILFQKMELLNMDSLNIINNEECKEDFYKLSEEQRDKPETQMRNCQKIFTGGVLSSLVEHVGDLTHRMAEKMFIKYGNIEGTLEFVFPKIERALKTLRNTYSIGTEHEQNFENNFDENLGVTFEDYVLNIKKEFNKYSEEHSKLEVYNEAQYAAREAAVALGKIDFKTAEKHLSYLEKIINNETYLLVASSYDPDFEKNKLDLNLKTIKKRILKR